MTRTFTYTHYKTKPRLHKTLKRFICRHNLQVVSYFRVADNISLDHQMPRTCFYTRVAVRQQFSFLSAMREPCRDFSLFRKPSNEVRSGFPFNIRESNLKAGLKKNMFIRFRRLATRTVSVSNSVASDVQYEQEGV